MSTAPSSSFHVQHDSPAARRRSDVVGLTDWEVDVTGFSGAPFLDEPWRVLAARLAKQLDVTLVGAVIVTIGNRGFSTRREPLRFRFTTTTDSGVHVEDAETTVRFEVEPGTM